MLGEHRYMNDAGRWIMNWWTDEGDPDEVRVDRSLSVDFHGPYARVAVLPVPPGEDPRDVGRAWCDDHEAKMYEKGLI